MCNTCSRRLRLGAPFTTPCASSTRCSGTPCSSTPHLLALGASQQRRLPPWRAPAPLALDLRHLPPVPRRADVVPHPREPRRVGFAPKSPSDLSVSETPQKGALFSTTAPRSCPFACRGSAPQSLDLPRCACVTLFHRLWRAVFGELRVPRSHINRAKEVAGRRLGFAS